MVRGAGGIDPTRARVYVCARVKWEILMCHCPNGEAGAASLLTDDLSVQAEGKKMEAL